MIIIYELKRDTHIEDGSKKQTERVRKEVFKVMRC